MEFESNSFLDFRRQLTKALDEDVSNLQAYQTTNYLATQINLFKKKKENNLRHYIAERTAQWQDYIRKFCWNVGHKVDFNLDRLGIKRIETPNWYASLIQIQNEAGMKNIENFNLLCKAKLMEFGTQLTISPVVCQKFPKSLPLFTNYRDLDPEHITNLILQFSGLINKQKMDIKAVYLQEDLELIIDGTHRFIALMIFKGFTPETYFCGSQQMNNLTSSILNISYYPPFIEPTSLLKLATCSNYTNKATKKDTFWTHIFTFHHHLTLNKGEILDKDTLKKSIVIEKSASNSEIFNLVYNLERTENWDNFIKFVYEPSKKYNYEKNQKINIEYFPSIIRNTDEKSVVFRYLNTLFQQGKNCNKLLDKSKVGEVVFRVSISCVWIKDIYELYRLPWSYFQDFCEMDQRSVDFSDLPEFIWKIFEQMYNLQKGSYPLWSEIILPTSVYRLNSQKTLSFFKTVLLPKFFAVHQTETPVLHFLDYFKDEHNIDKDPTPPKKSKKRETSPSKSESKKQKKSKTTKKRKHNDEEVDGKKKKKQQKKEKTNKKKKSDISEDEEEEENDNGKQSNEDEDMEDEEAEQSDDEQKKDDDEEEEDEEDQVKQSNEDEDMEDEEAEQSDDDEEEVDEEEEEDEEKQSDKDKEKEVESKQSDMEDKEVEQSDAKKKKADDENEAEEKDKGKQSKESEEKEVERKQSDMEDEEAEQSDPEKKKDHNEDEEEQVKQSDFEKKNDEDEEEDAIHFSFEENKVADEEEVIHSSFEENKPTDEEVIRSSFEENKATDEEVIRSSFEEHKVADKEEEVIRSSFEENKATDEEVICSSFEEHKVEDEEEALQSNAMNTRVSAKGDVEVTNILRDYTMQEAMNDKSIKSMFVTCKDSSVAKVIMERILSEPLKIWISKRKSEAVIRLGDTQLDILRELTKVDKEKILIEEVRAKVKEKNVGLSWSFY